MKSIAVISALALASMASVGEAAERSVTLDVPGMYCEMCPVTVSKALKKVNGVERVKASARRLLRLHPLRAADALQLGAALAWADGAPEGLIVHTFDRRLAAAAEREGFRVIPSP